MRVKAANPLKTKPLCHSTPGTARVIGFLDNAQALRRSEGVRRALHPLSATVEDVRVDHCGANVLVPKELLPRADIVPVLEQMCGERVPNRVAG
jgi:hypothetical protein